MYDTTRPPVLSTTNNKQQESLGDRQRKSPEKPLPPLNNPPYPYDDDDVYPSSSFNIPTALFDSEIDQLIDQLTELGFDGAARFVGGNDMERIKAALQRALARPAGTIRNLPGYIRYLVKTPGAIPKPDHIIEQKAEADKYKKGKYAHLVRR